MTAASLLLWMRHGRWMRYACCGRVMVPHCSLLPPHVQVCNGGSVQAAAASAANATATATAGAIRLAHIFRHCMACAVLWLPHCF